MVQDRRYSPGSFQKIVDPTLHPTVAGIATRTTIVAERLAQQRHSCDAGRCSGQRQATRLAAPIQLQKPQDAGGSSGVLHSRLTTHTQGRHCCTPHPCKKREICTAPRCWLECNEKNGDYYTESINNNIHLVG